MVSEQIGSERDTAIAAKRTASVLRIIAQNQRYHFILTLCGIVIGAAFSVFGFLLAILGVSGSLEWVLKGVDLSSRLSNATPGALFGVLGAVILWRYRPEMVDIAEWDRHAVSQVARFARGYTKAQNSRTMFPPDFEPEIRRSESSTPKQ